MTKSKRKVLNLRFLSGRFRPLLLMAAGEGGRAFRTSAIASYRARYASGGAPIPNAFSVHRIKCTDNRQREIALLSLEAKNAQRVFLLSVRRLSYLILSDEMEGMKADCDSL